MTGSFASRETHGCLSFRLKNYRFKHYARQREEKNFKYIRIYIQRHIYVRRKQKVLYRKHTSYTHKHKGLLTRFCNENYPSSVIIK